MNSIILIFYCLKKLKFTFKFKKNKNMCSKSNFECNNKLQQQNEQLTSKDKECCSSTKLINDDDQIRQTVRNHYGSLAAACGDDTKQTETEKSTQKCCSDTGSCFGSNITVEYAQKLGYTKQDLEAVPDFANLGLGCGNPLAFTQISEGFVVLDLGSGAGFDAFIAARKVGSSGLVIGVDMTPQMISKSRENAAKNKITNVSFRLGEIEYLPVADSSVDLIISNCVLNLSPQKRQVLSEAYRVLKPGRSVVISDIVTLKPLPDNVRKDLALYAGCIAGATLVNDLELYLSEIGFNNVSICKKDGSNELLQSWSALANTPLDQYVFSAVIKATKPEQTNNQ